MRKTAPFGVSLSHCELPMRRAIAVHRRGAWPKEAALDEVTLAAAGSENLRKHAQTDADLASIRDDPRFPAG